MQVSLCHFVITLLLLTGNSSENDKVRVTQVRPMHAPPRRAAITESVSKDDDITTIIQACFLEIFQKNINKDENPSWFFSVFLKNIL